MEKDNRIWFIHFLRAVATIMVLASHLFVNFWVENPFISDISHTIPIEEPFSMPITVLITSMLEKVIGNMPQFAVTIFLLISGFLIPISLEGIKEEKFLLKRFFRIFPTTIICIGITTLTVNTYCMLNGLQMPFTIKDYLINVSLQREWFWISPIEYAIWTLEIEFKFYIICAAIKWISNLKSAKPLIVLSSIFYIFNYLTHGLKDFWINNNLLYIYKFVYVLSSNVGFLTLMFIGICFYNYYNKYWNTKKSLVVIGYLFVMSMLTTNYSLNTDYMGQTILIARIAAIITIVLAYILKEKIPYSRVLNFIGNISFPLYLLHCIVGYVLQNVIYNFCHNSYITMIVSVIIILSVAYLIHIFVENKGYTLGKKIIEKIC